MFRDKIQRIGNCMVACTENCSGINCSRAKGILPRCLYLEDDAHNSTEAATVIIGINPGKSNPAEQSVYKRSPEYKSVAKYWKENIKNTHLYYTRLRNFANELSCQSAFLWTELVKCEKKENFKIPLQTYRICTNKYLRKELECVPQKSLLLAAGKETYRAASLLFPNRIVLGIPHPSRNEFVGMFKGNGPVHRRQLLRKLKDSLIEFLTQQKGCVEVVFHNGGYELQ